MMDLISEHIATWTAARIVKPKGGRGRGRGANGQSPHGIKKLRELILELAVRGMLVPQDPNDEPASVLLEKIAKEKARLIKEGKIKKQKTLPKITEDEKSLALPEGWEWARLREIGRDWGQKTPDSEFTYIDVSAIDNKVGCVQTPNVLGASGAPSRARKLVKVGTVIYSTVRPYLKNISVIDQEYSPEPIASTAFAILHPLQKMPGQYISTYLRSPVFVRYVESVQTGIAYPAINDKQFFWGVIPVPPIAEQHRIVAKVDELMALCDKLEQQQTDSNDTHQTLVKTLLAALTTVADPAAFALSWQRIEGHFDTLFTTEDSIDQLKQTILQLAVMGKLVPQDPNDEPASTLLEKIAKEKARLIKEGKIKKQKPLPEITEDEKPFVLPDGWECVRFGSLAQDISTGPFGSMIHKSDYIEGGVPLINPSHMIDSVIVEETNIAVNEKKAKELKSYRLHEGDIVMARRGEMGRCALVGDRENDWLCGTGSFILRFHVDLCRRYLLLLFKTSYVRQYLGGESVGATMTNLNHGILNKLPILLPPSAEQHRIVAKVDELMALCDTLKERLHDAQATQVQLADAIVEKAVA